jgi:O-antigen biosynthesis alpha-1,2-rhamnosyltransferase
MIYIDITDTIKLTYTSGIQRVVRNIVCHSFHRKNITFVEFDGFKEEYFIISKNDHRLATVVSFKVKEKYNNSLLYNFSKKRLSRKQKLLVMKYLSIMSYHRKKIRNLFIKEPVKLQPKFQKEDTLFLADSTWNYHPWKEVRDAKNKGVKIKQIVYDILPIIYPSFFEDLTNFNFKIWFLMVQYYCDELFAISKTTADNYTRQSNPQYSSNQDIKVMLMGSDIVVSDEENLPLRKTDKKIRFLTVGTIEPRKNHQYVLDVFDRLWHQGYDEIEWHIVGNRGWHSDELMKILEYHPMVDKQLFFYPSLNDKELKELYLLSDCVIVPSIDEGFGLQVNEGLNYKCAIFLSNIEIFREFNLNETSYFSLQDNGDELKSKIIQYLDDGNNGYQIHNNIKYKWKDAVEDLINTLKK